MIPYSRPKLSDLFTLSQSKLLENHTLHSGTLLSQLDLMLDRTFERSFAVSVWFLLVRYPVIDSAQITTPRNAGFDNYKSLCLGK